MLCRPVARIFQQEGQKTKGGTFLNAILDVCSNRKAKHEMGGTYFKWGAGHHCPPAGDDPDALVGHMRPAGL